jgi:hypothetical protein
MIKPLSAAQAVKIAETVKKIPSIAAMIEKIIADDRKVKA